MKESNYKLRDIFSLLLEIIIQILFTIFSICGKFINFFIDKIAKLIKDMLNAMYFRTVEIVATFILIFIISLLLT